MYIVKNNKGDQIGIFEKLSEVLDLVFTEHSPTRYTLTYVEDEEVELEI